MAERLLHALWLQSPQLQAVLSALGSPATDVRAVGGCVRDTLLGRDVRDIDLATPDIPDVVVDKLTAAGLKAVPTGLDHGTVTAVADGQGFEITTLRKDTSCDGRHAAVEFTTDWHEDAARRDFTFNALSMTPSGQVFDFFGGWEDAQAGRVRFVGDPADRIQEDYLRILRFFRFQAHYGRCTPDPETLEACREYKTGLSGLSADRVRTELMKLLSAPDPSGALHLMNEAGVLGLVIPGMPDARAVARLVALEHSVSQADQEVRAALWVRRWCALVPGHDATVAKRFHMSRQDASSLRALSDAVSALPAGPDEAQWRSFLYQHHATAGDAILVAAAQLPRTDPMRVGADYKRACVWRQPVFPVTGRDLKSLGFAPGAALGQTLATLEQQWVASGFTQSRDDLLRSAENAKP